MPGYTREQGQERRRLFAATGRCHHCGGVQLPGKVLCEKCDGTRRKIRQRSIAEGKCERCGRHRGSASARLCADCLEKNRSEDSARYRKRREAGACVHCGGRAADGFIECVDCKQKTSTEAKRRRALLRYEVIAAYGGRCACCGETEFVFLELDHVRNDGAAHRRSVGRSRIYGWAKANGYPKSLQVLCANCNKGKALNHGTCPHKCR